MLFTPSSSYGNVIAIGDSLGIPTREYTISVSLLESEIPTEAFMVVETNASPTDGQFELHKQFEPPNLYTASAPNWEDADENYPLRYQILSNSGITLGTHSWVNERNLILLDDSNVETYYKKTLVLRVYDQLETFTEIVSNVEVFPHEYDLGDWIQTSHQNYAMNRNDTEWN